MKRFVHNPDLGLLIFRVFVGLSMALAHGLGKVPPSEQFVAGVASMGLPAPLLFAWAAALSELLGGTLIAFGIYTRLSAFFLAGTMAVAGFIIHAADPFQKKELAFFYLAACVLLILQGAGKYSLDKWLRKAN